MKVNKENELMEILKDKRVFSSKDAVVAGLEIFTSGPAGPFRNGPTTE
jgi:hypothetical protein